jgi:signal transduction histidine kinase
VDISFSDFLHAVFNDMAFLSGALWLALAAIYAGYEHVWPAVPLSTLAKIRFALLAPLVTGLLLYSLGVWVGYWFFTPELFAIAMWKVVQAIFGSQIAHLITSLIQQRTADAIAAAGGPPAPPLEAGAPVLVKPKKEGGGGA